MSKGKTWVSEAKRQRAFAKLLNAPTPNDIRWALACAISPATIEQVIGAKIPKELLDNPSEV